MLRQVDGAGLEFSRAAQLAKLKPRPRGRIDDLPTGGHYLVTQSVGSRPVLVGLGLRALLQQLQ